MALRLCTDNPQPPDHAAGTSTPVIVLVDGGAPEETHAARGDSRNSRQILRFIAFFLCLIKPSNLIVISAQIVALRWR
jgi:hypothetical protein